MPSRIEIVAWKDDAQRTLERAQVLSSRANDNLQESTRILTKQLPSKLNEVTAQVGIAKKAHTQLLVQVNDIERIATKLTASHQALIDKEMKPALLRLNKVLKELEQVEVPEFLIPSESGTTHHLSDFVSWSELDQLRHNIQIYEENCEKVSKFLLAQVSEIGDKFRSGSGKFTHTMKLYDSKVAEVKVLMNEAVGKSPPKNISNILLSLLKENTSLENELASVLKMLTNHFDQCTLAAQWNTATDEESLQVLQEDSMELPSVLKEIEAIHDIIENNLSRANQFMELKMPALEQVLNQCEKWGHWYSKFTNEDIISFLLLYLKCSELYDQSSLSKDTEEDSALASRKKSPVIEYTEILEQLHHHYEKFRSVYQKNYLTELHHEQFVYPRQYLKQLDEYLNVELLKLDRSEKERRRNWLQKYGEYIPRQFFLPGEFNQPQVIQVLSEGLDDVDSEATIESEAKLLELIKKLRA
ncbi:hypothetical protein PUMCH_001140 [Australozyma saopauloensis]|uniref:Autophagy-related protein 17 n=1 Tax=Australozyma saopauloensis TaxID=291208 RepID=A0AAX4H5P1_9ASCO|nr:hypothetical protein PUMCH_001140 [[Candida] saopauloensis]